MRRLGTTLALALCLLGCGVKPVPVPAPSGMPIQLLTYSGPCRHDERAQGLLVSDANWGTDISVMPTGTAVWPSAEDNGSSIVSVRWPSGFTGLRLAGGEVVVLDAAGTAVATTGHPYSLNGAWLLGLFGFETVPRVAGFEACGDPGSAIPR